MNGSALDGPRSRRARLAGWLVIAVAVVVLIVAGADTTPTSGVSQDRLYALAGEMKCLQCAGESVAGSQADIAIKMRAEIRAQMRRGRSDDEILAFFADRYGQRVLLNPSGGGVVALVWIVPVVFVALGIAGLATAFASSRRRRADDRSHEPTAEDTALVEAAMGDGRGHGTADDG